MAAVHKSDVEALLQNHQFVRDDDIDNLQHNDWKTRMSRRYYEALYKDHAIIDLSRSFLYISYGLKKCIITV